MPDDLSIRRATGEDAAALADFAATAFWDAYRDMDDAKDIAMYVDEHFHTAAIAGILADPGSFTLLAEIDSHVAGYAVINVGPAPACVLGPDPIELGRIYLDKAHTGKGYGAKLMQAVHALARNQGSKTIWLCVYDQNLRAIQFYEKVGFTRAGVTELVFGSRVCIDPIYCAPVQSGN